MINNIYDEKGLIQSENQMFNTQGNATNIKNDSVTIPKENITDFGNARYYFTCDGKKCVTMEQVMQYNQMYYDRMMNYIDDNNYVEKKTYR